jgi:hypothetical protein
MNTVYLLTGLLPVKQILGVYESFYEAKDALNQYFDRTLDEDGAGKYLYQFDKYIIESREVGREAFNQKRVWYVEFQTDYAAGTCKEVVGE